MIKIETVVERWYIQLSYNNKNSPAYVDMVKDMEKIGDGVFSCTFKIIEGNICDYVFIEREVYADPEPSKTH